MKTAVQRGLVVIGFIALTCLGSATAAATLQDAKTNLEVHEWGVWIVDPNLENANARDRYVSGMPVSVNSVRGREMRKDEVRLSPMNVITFYGDPVGDQEVTLQVPSGQFLAHWPTGELKNRRLRWPQLSFSKADSDQTGLAFVADDHWFQQARRIESLYVRHGARVERFLAYDAELKFPVPFRIEGGGQRYRITNTGNWPLLDVLVCAPESAGVRVGWVDRVPAAAPDATKPSAPASSSENGPDEPKEGSKHASQVASSGEVAMSALLTEREDELASATTRALAERLARAGLNRDEIELLSAQYSKDFFAPRELVVIFRLPPDAIDPMVPIELFPEAKKIVRVALVLVRNIDPRMKDEVQALIVRLGDPKYSEREAAEKRLIELGAVAVPALKEALKNADLEIVFRAERILLSRNEKIE